MFKTETHLHTSEISPCSKLTAAEMVKLYHEAGYSTIFVTDHFSRKYIRLTGDITWEEKVDHFFDGYEAAKKEGEKYGMNVLCSCEICIDIVSGVNSSNHYLLFNINKEFLKLRSNILDTPIHEFYPLAKKYGITVIQAHPLRDEKSSPTPEYVDGFEVFNSNPRHKNFSDNVLKIAREHNLLMTAGSDAHRVEDVGCAGVLSETEIKTTDEFLELLKNGNLKIFEGNQIL